MKTSTKTLTKLAVLGLSLTIGAQVTSTHANAMMLHKVQKGENLYQISKHYGMTVENLIHNNHLHSAKIAVNQVLEIHNSVQVKKGDTLDSIAKKYHKPVSEIKKLNGLKSNAIKEGQVLKVYSSNYYHVVIDENGHFAEIGVPNQETPKNSPKVVTIHTGDTLHKIAKEYHTTVVKLKSLNHLTSDKIYIGQDLKVR